MKSDAPPRSGNAPLTERNPPRRGGFRAWRFQRQALTAGLALFLTATACWSEENPAPKLQFSGLLDIRAYAADRKVSWLRGGTNRLRYGGRDTDNDGIGDRHLVGASIPQASLVLESQVHSLVKLHVQTNFTTDAASGSAKIGVIEAYAQAAMDFGDDSFQARAGGFIPPVSWEHSSAGGVWSTRYTLTPSAIGSWVGEEVRVLGGELFWERKLSPQIRSRATAGFFSGGDQIGRLLWDRGWSLNDFQGDLTVEYPLSGRKVRPVEELDGDLGYYGRGDISLFDEALQIGGGYWTNNADTSIGQPGNALLDIQPFRTSLLHFGGQWQWKGLTVISQFLKATVSSNGRSPRDWPAAYGLASWQWKKLRLSGRYDRFWSTQSDTGHAYTAFVAVDATDRQQLSLEYVYFYSRLTPAVSPAAEADRVVQANYRLRF